MCKESLTPYLLPGTNDQKRKVCHKFHLIIDPRYWGLSEQKKGASFSSIFDPNFFCHFPLYDYRLSSAAVYRLLLLPPTDQPPYLLKEWVIFFYKDISF